MICHSYARFSSKTQGEGDSLRRQQSLAVEFCKRKGYTLSAQPYHDKGRSGFRGDKQKALKALLQAVKDGQIKSGETLIVEAIDRLSRKELLETNDMFTKIFKAGVNIQILSPSEKLYEASKARNDLAMSIELTVAAHAAHSYSELLSQRIKADLGQRRNRVREQAKGETLSNRIPGWLRREGDRLEVIPEARQAVEYAFKRTIEGVGRRVLLREMNARFKPIGSSGAWNATALSLMLVGKRLRLPDGKIVVARAVCGESVSTITGEVFKPYPVIITPKRWEQAAAMYGRRCRKKGPPTSRVNLLAGLLHWATDNSHGAIFTMYQPTNKKGVKRATRRYQSYKGRNDEPGADKVTIEAEKLETMLLEFMPRLDLGAKKADRRGEVEDRIELLEAELRGVQQTAKDRPTGAAALATVIATLAEQIDSLRGELAAIGDASIRPTKDYRAKLAAMRRGTNEERELLRDRLLGIISAVWVAPVKLGTFAASRVKIVLEIHFRDGSRVRGIEINGKLIQAGAKKPLRQEVIDGVRFDAATYAKWLKLLG